MKIKNAIKKVVQKFKEFLNDDSGGNIIEYALLLGFALFIFFIIVGVITSMMDWTVGQSNSFFEIIEDLGG